MRTFSTLFSKVALAVLLPWLSQVAAAESTSFPDTIALPDGFRPEGIVRGYGTEFFAGSLADGRIYKGDLRTGAGDVFVTATGEAAIGLDFDPRTGYLFVAGGNLGTATVYDGRTGLLIEKYTLATGTPTFVNDVIVTRTAVFFTDSFQPALYRLPLLPAGDVPGPAAVETLLLGGDFVFVPSAFNANGIVAAAAGRALIVVSSVMETLYRVDPVSGEALAIDLGGVSLPNGDGLLLAGRTLYAVQNRLNQVAVIELAPGLLSGVVVDSLTDPDFDVPTTVTSFGDSLYTVNARFGTPPTPSTQYDVVRVEKR